MWYEPLNLIAFVDKSNRQLASNDTLTNAL